MGVEANGWCIVTAEHLFQWERSEVIGKDIGILMNEAMARHHHNYITSYILVCHSHTSHGFVAVAPSLFGAHGNILIVYVDAGR